MGPENSSPKSRAGGVLLPIGAFPEHFLWGVGMKLIFKEKEEDNPFSETKAFIWAL